MTGIAPVIDRISVRMYRKLLGDCFLITINGTKGTAATRTHIMIDCGVLQGTPNAGDLMEQVVKDVYDHTGGKPLDLIVVTHEHHDHISGFSLASEVFEAQAAKSKVTSNLWFAWTEDPQDEDARKYQAAYGQALSALTAMAGSLKVPTAASADDQKARILGLAGFSGPLGLDAASGNKPLRGSRKIYANLRKWAGSGGTKYLSPGQVLTSPGTLGLRTFVLGPPRDKEHLLNPLGSGAETYLAMSSDKNPLQFQKGSPFSPRNCWRTDKQIQKIKRTKASGAELWLHDRYYRDYSPCVGRSHHSKAADQACSGNFTLHEPQEYRRLDSSVRSTFANLALKMDNSTNNTSLVLAFELPGDAGVMLFAADAQVGNWMSWDKVKFREQGKSTTLPLTSASLLGRTRLYKVGHHGSHNATMRDKGLELMNDDLVALIPTDAEFAAQQSSAWQMPNPKVETALMAKTRGRVLRGDRDKKVAIDAHRAAAPENAADFAARVSETDLWVEYVAYERGKTDVPQ